MKNLQVVNQEAFTSQRSIESNSAFGSVNDEGPFAAYEIILERRLQQMKLKSQSDDSNA